MESGVTALSYEDLRVKARLLENEIDRKLVSFNKLAAGLEAPRTLLSASADTVPLLADGEDTFDNMASEIEQQLGRLSVLNERMAEQPVSGAAMMHTVRRHHDILKDLQRDYRKTSSQHEARRDRESLLGSPSTSEKFRNDGVNNRRDLYLKENTHLNTSDRLVSEQIAIAMETKEHLHSQRRTFKNMQTRFNDMSNRFPVINSLVQRINLRKRRDSIIIGLVVAICTILMLLYAFH